MRIVTSVLRVTAAALVIAAIVGQLALSVENWTSNGEADFAYLVTNFFSFFTIESNVLSVVILLVGAGLGFAGRGDGPVYGVARAAVVTYMATTGIVYNLLLRGIELPQGTTLPWSNEVLHVVGPIVLVLDWLFAPGRVALPWKRIWAIIAFPLAWVIYTLVRGIVVMDPATGSGWYPYPFLNPATSQNGYSSVAFYVVLIAVVISAVGAGVIALSRRSGPAAETATHERT